MRNLCLLVVLIAVSGQVYAQEGWYDIVSVKSEQLQNAARVTINMDGAIDPDFDPWMNSGYYYDYDLVRKVGWTGEGVYANVREIRFCLWKCRTQVGNFVNVGKYPISHIEFSTSTEPRGTQALDVSVCLYSGVKFRQVTSHGWTSWDGYVEDHHDPINFEAIASPDKRSMIITVTTDRMPQTPQRRKPEDVAEKDREMSVDYADGALNVHAKSARLTELIQEVNTRSGKHILVDSSTERVVTAELSHITVDDFLDRVSECYGLARNGTIDAPTLCDMSARTTNSYTTSALDQIQVKNLKAETIRGLLPNCMLDYIMVDAERNLLIVSGSPSLVRKIREDVEKLDLPGRQVRVSAKLMEVSSTEELVQDMALKYSDSDYSISTQSTTGEITYKMIEGTPEAFESRIRALSLKQKAQVVSEPSQIITSGQKGSIFSGIDKYILLQDRYGDTHAEPISIGSSLAVTPWLGDGAITLKIVTEDSNIGSVDVITGLPTVDVRRAEGTFVIRPHQAVVIGGLSQTQSFNIQRKIPILGDIPLIGELFKTRTRQRPKSEMVVVLTAEEFKGISPNAIN